MSKLNLIADIESNTKTRKRLFEAGEMKVLVLHFISQQTKFSYDIIKDVSMLVGGDYKPSTGTICPTINYLEEQQYTAVTMTEDQRKQYHITPKGQDHLAAQQKILHKVLSRFNARHHIQNNAEYIEIKIAMEALKAALRQNLQFEPLSPAHISLIAEKINHAATQISQISEQEKKS